MSRSKHTDPRSIRAARRIRVPGEQRAAGDPSRRRELGRKRKEAGVPGNEERRTQHPGVRLRVILRRPRPGFHHPAGKEAVLAMLAAVGPVAQYGLRSVELARAPVGAPRSAPLLGRYQAPGRIVLFEQPTPPWRLSGVLGAEVRRRMERAGAVLTVLADGDATLVDWPQNTLRRFMLEEVLLHELGHHVLQHHKGKRPQRIARTRDHEACAARFAERQRCSLRKGRGPFA